MGRLRRAMVFVVVLGITLLFLGGGHLKFNTTPSAEPRGLFEQKNDKYIEQHEDGQIKLVPGGSIPLVSGTKAPPTKRPVGEQKNVATEKPTTIPITPKPASEKPRSTDSAKQSPVTDKDKNATQQPVTEEPKPQTVKATEKPKTEKPRTTKPPATENPVTEKPETEVPKQGLIPADPEVPLMVLSQTAKVNDDSKSRYSVAWTTWSRLQRAEIVFLGDDTESTVLARANGFRVEEEYERHKNSPLYRAAFQAAEKRAQALGAPSYGYANSDLMFTSDFMKTVEAVLRQGWKKFFIVGKRWNVDLPEGFVLKGEGQDWESQVKDLKNFGKEFQTNAEDYFIMSPGTFDWTKIPGFIIGGRAFDNWLVHKAVLDPTIETVDASKTITNIHVNHGAIFGSHKNEASDINARLGNGQWGKGVTTNCKWVTSWDDDDNVVLTNRKQA
eukprot:Rmarinus@m.12254